LIAGDKSPAYLFVAISSLARDLEGWVEERFEADPAHREWFGGAGVGGDLIVLKDDSDAVLVDLPALRVGDIGISPFAKNAKDGAPDVVGELTKGNGKSRSFDSPPPN
jgi:hypothetical protein